MKTDRSVTWADSLSRLRNASSPTPSAALSDGGATRASSAGESSTGEEPDVHAQHADELASSACGFLKRCSSSAPEERLKGQHLFSRRFRCAATEAEYVEWHFSIWGRRTANFAICVAALVLVNLAIVLAGGSSTRRRALDVDDSLHALNCLVTAPIAGALFAGASVFLFSRTSLYSATVHQFTTVAFLAIAFAIDTVPRVVYAESDAAPPEGGLCNVTGMELAEVVSLAAGDAAAFAYAQGLILAAVATLAGLRPSGCTVVVVTVAYLGHRDQNAMSALCFSDASPSPDFFSRIPALVAAVALSFALNDRYRREFVLQQLVRAVTVERVKSEQEARDWAQRLEESSAVRAALCNQGPAPSVAGSSCATNSEIDALHAQMQSPTQPAQMQPPHKRQAATKGAPLCGSGPPSSVGSNSEIGAIIGAILPSEPSRV